ncbi:putative ATPase [Arcicella aurantiaca]|uniref:Putative ATPase n=1 Tax=Arcicella aurantiaca TaxID=591202 RepID=A0A316E3R1_9BACT|nr:AAA family ATPase [Arcicella aurantiaca]PWK23353.1 putative ATPase [Arcicella aurantiaca]
MKIEKIKVKNYKVFEDTEINNLPSMCVFLGANGAGKSTLFDVFGFLSEALRNNVKSAINNRGGFKEVISRNKSGDIEFEIKFRNDDIDRKRQPLITYELSIGLEQNMPIVRKEVLSYRRGQKGKPFKFLDFSNGKGMAIINEIEFEQAKQDFKEEREEFPLDSPDILAIKGLGQFQNFKAISDFRKLLESWYISNFQIPDAKKSQDIGVSEQLSPTGDNLALVTDYIFENYPKVFEEILEKMKKRVPGITNVTAAKTEDGRIILRFQDGSFKDPFISRYVSDGTLKMFAYLVLMNNPQKHPLLCIEEPENYLHPELLRQLAEEFREYSHKGGQVFISTHSPDFVNALELDEVFWLTKKDGYTTIKRAKDDETVRSLVEAGDNLGYLWNQKYFKGSGPL